MHNARAQGLSVAGNELEEKIDNNNNNNNNHNKEDVIIGYWLSSGVILMTERLYWVRLAVSEPNNSKFLVKLAG